MVEPRQPASIPDEVSAPGPISVEQMGRALRRAVGERKASLLHLPLSWNSAIWPFCHPLDYLGSDGGGGIGSGPGIAVGAALALRSSGRLPIAICGDGDFLMGVTALWTAVHYRIPLLVVVANNRSFFNDEMHQERMARMRNRPVENRWIGQHIRDPDIDLAQLARAQGAEGFGPVHDATDMPTVFDAAIAAVERGNVAVVNVRVTPATRRRWRRRLRVRPGNEGRVVALVALSDIHDVAARARLEDVGDVIGAGRIDPRRACTLVCRADGRRGAEKRRRKRDTYRSDHGRHGFPQIVHATGRGVFRLKIHHHWHCDARHLRPPSSLGVEGEIGISGASDERWFVRVRMR
jgi:hypothetical protein